jgi:polyhydroxybutyrate depolymerase
MSIYFLRITVATLILALLVSCGSVTPTTTPPTATAVPTVTPTLPLPTAMPPTATPTDAVTPPITENYQKPGDYYVGIESFGAQRTFILHVPLGYRPGVLTPVVFNLHGYDSTASKQKNLTRMDVTADREGFIVVYPQALQVPPMWTGFMPGPAGYADIRFFEDMLAFLEHEMSIDPARIYATGISNGAVMANHLACELPDVFAAIAPVAGNHIGYDTCKVELPVSVAVFHGTKDRTAPYNGGGSGVPPVHTWVEAWAERDGCDPDPDVSHPNSNIMEETWTNCDENAQVTLYTIEGGRHEWPGSAFGPGPYPDGMAPDIYATDAIWEFFKSHPKSISSSNAALAGVPEPSPVAKYQTPGNYIDNIMVNGIKRWFTVHIPPGYQPGMQLPLVISLHSYRGTAFAQEEMTQMNAKADEEAFIAVHPQAYNDPPAWTGPLLDQGGEQDLIFFRLLMTYLQQSLSVDPARIYATGFSNGATMANTLGCFMSDTFAAIAPVAGGHSAYGLCPIEQPVSVLVIHGTADPTIPYYGREGEVPAVHSWVEAWAERNACGATPSTSYPQETAIQETWENCDQGTEVTLITREGGSHVWPGSALAEQSEGTPSNMDATDVIWAFFEAHPRLLEP